MIMHLLPRALPTLLHMTAQEDGSDPGKGLTALQTITYFIITPLALFLTITIVVVIASADRSKVSKSDLTRID